MRVFGGIETGGTTCELAVGTGPDDLRATETIPTTTPADTIARAVEFFTRHGPVDALGVGSFGPIDPRRDSPTWGHVTTTPKPGWANVDLAGELGRRLGVPVAFDTDVNAAALGEHRWGAARGLQTFCYVTVGTGIGGGAIVNGELLHGLVHPEFGHLRVPRLEDTEFAGACPYHDDCWEGLASAPAIAARHGRAPDELDDEDAWALEARYLALGLVAVTSILAPQRIALGGGVLQRDGLLDRVRAEVAALLNGYGAAGEIVAPELAPRSGVLGALALASNDLAAASSGGASST